MAELDLAAAVGELLGDHAVAAGPAVGEGPDLAREGVRIVGRALCGSGVGIRLGRDLPDACIAAEPRRRVLLSRIDAHISASNSS